MKKMVLDASKTKPIDQCQQSDSHCWLCPRMIFSKTNPKTLSMALTNSEISGQNLHSYSDL